MRRDNVDSYLLVDLRMSEQPSVTGGYFSEASSACPLPIPRQDLTKFDTMPGFDRIYDSGNIIIYALSGAQNAPWQIRAFAQRTVRSPIHPEIVDSCLPVLVGWLCAIPMCIALRTVCLPADPEVVGSCLSVLVGCPFAVSMCFAQRTGSLPAHAKIVDIYLPVLVG